MRSKIDWASLLWEGNLPFLLCFTLYSRENSKYKPLGGLYSEGRFNGGFFTLPFWGPYTWRGLFWDFCSNLMISFLLTISCVFCFFSFSLSTIDQCRIQTLKYGEGREVSQKIFSGPSGISLVQKYGAGLPGPFPGSAIVDCWFLSSFFCLTISASVVICLCMCLILLFLSD